MNYPSYDWIAVSKDFSKLDFTSIGRKGPIRKRVVFSKMELDGVYNLAFGDLDNNGEIDDITRMAIGLHLSELSLDFDVYALNNEQWVQFARDLKVDAFLIKKKNM